MCLVSFTNRLNKFLAKRKKIFHLCTKFRDTERNEDTPPPSTRPPSPQSFKVYQEL